MAVRKTTLEKAVAVLRLLEGGEGSAASGDPPRVREDSQSGKYVKVLEQWLLCLPIYKGAYTDRFAQVHLVYTVPTWKCVSTYTHDIY